MRVHAELRSKLLEITGKDMYRRFLQHRQRAKRQGIGFHMDFPQWVQAWGEKLTERGSRRGQFVMCRNGDAGPYKADNVTIRTTQSNIDEGYRVRARQAVKAAWSFDGQDRSSCADWLENRRDMGYL